jgi:sucrose-6-phosphate hydrolase SacC (GH32 family)
MALMLPGEYIVQFYSSKNLKAWKHLSDFGNAEKQREHQRIAEKNCVSIILTHQS